jgi:hypothetical protein
MLGVSIEAFPGPAQPARSGRGALEGYVLPSMAVAAHLESTGLRVRAASLRFHQRGRSAA